MAGSSRPYAPLWPAGSSRRRRLLPSVWLAFLALPLASMAHSDRSVQHLTVVIVLVVGFAALYTWNVACEPSRARRWLGVVEVATAPLFLAVPLFLSFYDNGAWAYCFVYSLLPLIRLWSTRWRWAVVVAVAAITAGTGAAAGLDASDVFAAVCIVAGTGGTWAGFGRILEANAALREAQEDKAQAAVAEERLRFARDLHDLLGHSLSVIALKSEVAGRLLDHDAGRARAEVAEIEDVARRALREVREAVSGYRRPTLAVELAGARAALADAGVTWEEDVDERAAAALPTDVEAVLAWGLREGTTNVLRHSRAGSCSLRLTVGDTAEVAIVDDGVGCGGLRAAGGCGLAGLGERAAALGGTVDAGAGPGGRGFRLSVRVPVAGDRPAAPVPAPALPAL